MATYAQRIAMHLRPTEFEIGKVNSISHHFFSICGYRVHVHEQWLLVDRMVNDGKRRFR